MKWVKCSLLLMQIYKQSGNVTPFFSFAMCLFCNKTNNPILFCILTPDHLLSLLRLALMYFAKRFCLRIYFKHESRDFVREKEMRKVSSAK